MDSVRARHAAVSEHPLAVAAAGETSSGAAAESEAIGAGVVALGSQPSHPQQHLEYSSTSSHHNSSGHNSSGQQQQQSHSDPDNTNTNSHNHHAKRRHNSSVAVSRTGTHTSGGEGGGGGEKSHKLGGHRASASSSATAAGGAERGDSEQQGQGQGQHRGSELRRSARAMTSISSSTNQLGSHHAASSSVLGRPGGGGGNSSRLSERMRAEIRATADKALLAFLRIILEIHGTRGRVTGVCKEREGRARRDAVWRRVAWRGGVVWCGVVWCGVAWRGVACESARQGDVSQVAAREGRGHQDVERLICVLCFLFFRPFFFNNTGCVDEIAHACVLTRMHAYACVCK